MTPAELARKNAIAFECKKDALQQRQSGDWKISFTVHSFEMDERITHAAMGTRYQAVLVEINDDELPVHQPAKETIATPQPMPHTAGAKRMEWRELQPATQAGIRCEDPVFMKFLDEIYAPTFRRFTRDAARTVRFICCVESRSELGTNHRARVLWKQLDDEFLGWKALERA